MQSTLFDLALADAPHGSSGRTCPACSARPTMPSELSWQDWSAAMPPSIRQGAEDGRMRVWFLAPCDAPHGAFWTPSTSAWRNDGGASSSSLADILEGPDDGTDLTRYYRSSKACAGILRRAEKRGKTLPAPLAAALRAVAGSEPTSISGGGSVSATLKGRHNHDGRDGAIALCLNGGGHETV